MLIKYHCNPTYHHPLPGCKSFLIHFPIKLFNRFFSYLEWESAFSMIRKAQHCPSLLHFVLVSHLFYLNCPLFHQAHSTVPQLFTELVLPLPTGIHSLSHCPFYIKTSTTPLISTVHTLLPRFIVYFSALITHLFCLLSVSFTKIKDLWRKGNFHFCDSSI